MSSPTKLSAIVTQNPAIRQLLDEAARFGDLTERARGIVGPTLATHIIGTVMRHDSLIVLADSAAWAAKLRYQTPILLDQLPRVHPQYSQIRAVRIKVAVPRTPSERNPMSAAEIGDRAVDALNQQAECVGDPDLARALKRLASRGKP